MLKLPRLRIDSYPANDRARLISPDVILARFIQRECIDPCLARSIRLGPMELQAVAGEFPAAGLPGKTRYAAWLQVEFRDV